MGHDDGCTAVAMVITCRVVPALLSVLHRSDKESVYL
jgi:hypothetical protein